MKIVLNFYGEPDHTEKELADILKTTRTHGTTGLQMKEGAEALGFKAEVIDECSFEDIENWLKKGVPVIVNWFTRGRDDYDPEVLVSEGHYSVVCGLDDEHIYFQDPEIGGMRKITRDGFMQVWFDFEGDVITPENLTPRRLIAIYK